MNIYEDLNIWKNFPQTTFACFFKPYCCSLWLLLRQSIGHIVSHRCWPRSSCPFNKWIGLITLRNVPKVIPISIRLVTITHIFAANYKNIFHYTKLKGNWSPILFFFFLIWEKERQRQINQDSIYFPNRQDWESGMKSIYPRWIIVTQ